MTVPAERLDASASGPANALEAAHRIRAVHETMVAISRIAEAQVMEAAWTIRREHPDRDAFERFVAERVGVLAPEKAWLMAQTWDAARGSPELRDLARTRPADAMDFVRGYVEAGLQERLGGLDETDRAAVRLASQPRRLRAHMRDLVRQHDANRDRIEALERERDDAVAELVAERGGASRLDAHPMRAADDLRDAESRLAEIADRLAPVLAAATESVRSRVLATNDLAMGHLERIAAAVYGGEEDV